MLHLLTGNPRKYEPLGDLLARLQIALRKPEFAVPELQDDDFAVVLARKAREAAQAFGGPCLVDDSGLLLDAYPGFPGPLTRSACKMLGAAGLERLLKGVTPGARMVCHLGCWADGRLWNWSGEAGGHLDPTRPVGDGPGPLTQWFVPDEPGPASVFLHRRRALEALARDIDRLRAAVSRSSLVESNPECVFCQEFDGQGSSVYHDLLGHELPSRIVHRTPHFLALPPLGQFVEGGLLLATREHRISMAHLPGDYYDELERLMQDTSGRLLKRYGCRPLFFEHAPAAPGVKGTCCVDHAHLNVFPVAVAVHEHLKRFPHTAIGRMRELAGPEYRDHPYLFLQTNAGERFVYQAGIVPSQHIRKIVTAVMGMPERGHWRDYLGLDELKRTFCALSDWS
jgi:inosine/xanthosine triphosphate pyrophosphatase family protein